MYRMSEMLGNKINDFKLYVDCIFKYVSLYPPDIFSDEIPLNLEHWGQLWIWKLGSEILWHPIDWQVDSGLFSQLFLTPYRLSNGYVILSSFSLMYTWHQPKGLKSFLIFEIIVFQLLLLNIFLFQVSCSRMTHDSPFWICYPNDSAS